MSRLIKIKQEAYAAIERRFHCLHPKRELRLRIIADKRKAHYRQCITCGAAGRAISTRETLSEIGQNKQAPQFNDDLEAQWYAQKHVAYLLTYSEIEPILREEYEQYLKSPEWRSVRSRILNRANGKCECCERAPPTEVHHTTYVRLGNELDDDLLAVCAFCHWLIHNQAAV